MSAALARVLAAELERELGHPVDQGVLDPTFHRDDLERVGTRLAEPTALPVPVEGREIVLVDDVVFTGRTVRAALEALHTWGRPACVKLLAMVDRGHRELPIQPDFVGRVVPTSRHIGERDALGDARGALAFVVAAPTDHGAALGCLLDGADMILARGDFRKILVQMRSRSCIAKNTGARL